MKSAIREPKKTTSEVMNSSVPSAGPGMRPRGPPVAGAGEWGRGGVGEKCAFSRSRRLPLSRSLDRRSHSGRALSMGGSAAKLYAGGGEVVAHSSVQASHGLSPAGFPFRRLQNLFHSRNMVARAVTNAPVVILAL